MIAHKKKTRNLRKTELVIFLAAGALIAVVYVILHPDNPYLFIPYMNIFGGVGWDSLRDYPYTIKPFVYALLRPIILTAITIIVLFVARLFLCRRTHRAPVWVGDILVFGGGFIAAFIGGLGVHLALAMTFGLPSVAYSAHLIMHHLDNNDMPTAKLLFAATFAWAVTFLIWLGEWLLRLIKQKFLILHS